MKKGFQKSITIEQFTNAKNKRYISPAKLLAIQHTKKVKRQYHWVKEHEKKKDATEEKSFYDKVFSGEVNLEEETKDPFLDPLKEQGIIVNQKNKKRKNSQTQPIDSQKPEDSDEQDEKPEQVTEEKEPSKSAIESELEKEIRKKVKHDRFYEARVEAELKKAQDEKIQKEREEKQRKKEEYTTKKKEQSKIFRKRTKKGQPIMKDIANRLLSKLEKDANKE